MDERLLFTGILVAPDDIHPVDLLNVVGVNDQVPVKVFMALDAPMSSLISVIIENSYFHP